MTKVGLYFGTFNPVHVGHLIIANYMADNTGLDEVWLVVTPQNPLKQKNSLLADYHRLALVRVGIENNPKLKQATSSLNYQSLVIRQQHWRIYAKNTPKRSLP